MWKKEGGVLAEHGLARRAISVLPTCRPAKIAPRKALRSLAHPTSYAFLRSSTEIPPGPMLTSSNRPPTIESVWKKS